MLNVSVIIPTFDRAHLIEESVSSVLSQTFKPKEVIVVDDGSSDNSVLIVKKKISNYKILFIKNSSNKGTSYSRNEIIKKAKGDLICFMDDDDISDKSRVYHQIKSIYEEGYPNNNKIISQNKALLARLERLEKIALSETKSQDLATIKLP